MSVRLTFLVLFLAVQGAAAQPASPASPPPAVSLTLSPAAAPVPALKYHFLPDLLEQTPGNAALFYARAMQILAESRLPAGYQEKLDQWLEMPVKEFPREEVRRALAGYRNVLHEIDLAARVRHCDWGLDDRQEGINLLLPEMQRIRQLAIFVTLRARLQIADGQFDQALGSLQTGFAMARHVAQGPTLIQALVGVAVASRMAQCIEEWIQMPGAPNLYWALTALPRPFIDLREPLQGEQVLVARSIPGLRELETTVLTPEQTRERLDGALKLFGLISSRQSLHPGEELGLVALVARSYPTAKRFLIKQGRSRELVEAMSPLQVVMLYSMQQYNRHRDDLFKWFNLPFWQAAPRLQQAEREVQNSRQNLEEGLPLAALVLPAIGRVYGATVRIDRRIAALRCIEAVRLYAAAHDGDLPASLAAITAVPIPHDPGTGKSFDYQTADNKASLKGSPPPGEPPTEHNVLSYELSLKP